MDFTERKDKMKELKKQGKTYQEIGKIFNLSRQRVHQIIMDIKFEKETIPPTFIDNCWLPVGEIFRNGFKNDLEGRDFLRERVRHRDDYTCQICKKVWEKGKRRFDVHHLDGNIEGKNAFTYKNNKCFNRMITLCHKCHLNLNHIKEKIKNGRDKVLI
jgi:hypothetical protein